MITAKRQRRGSLLLTVLIVVVMLTLTCAAFYEWSFAEYKAADVGQRQLQTKLAAESGIEYVRYFLALDEAVVASEGGKTNNPADMQAILSNMEGQIADQPGLRCRYTILAPALDTYGEFAGYRYGLEDESARLNLNSILVADARDPDAALGRTLLMGLPGMTEPIADAILDWLDEDDEPREFGAERDHYSSLSPAYEPQNGPLESIDQLLLVRDVTPELLYGFDRNRNFFVDADEAQLYGVENVDNSTGSMNRGWASYLTLRSGEKNLRADGTPKIDINSDDLETLHQELSEVLDAEQANFIIAYRQGGPNEEDDEESDEVEDVGGQTEQRKSAGSLDFDYEQNGSVPINSLLDLIGTETRVVENGQTQRTIVEEAFPNEPGAMAAYLPLMMENLTAGGQAVIPGRLNINQAPRVLLEGLSMTMPEALPPQAVEQILANRSFEPAIDQPDQMYETWLLSSGVLTLEQMKQLMPMVTAGGDIYRAQVVGYYEADGPYTRLEAVIDNSGVIPKISSVRDLSPLGAGFTVEQLGAMDLAPME
ncbi:general secretion pathway protein GspK [Aeoliella sp. ICT_H6.2]|uniref:General secretion pathway protein GspK n=1 Tax=Aeoliella straminimaris TaxID=2954799 RepID=A0A9X2JJH1_9BACT|nr:type II secretion system protein GspK [Aeoliella straminimaris]MCO6047592.1 general secretion pathway protein GspK [Aeoliella straminimaris]